MLKICILNSFRIPQYKIYTTGEHSFQTDGAIYRWFNIVVDGAYFYLEAQDLKKTQDVLVWGEATPDLNMH